MFKNLTIMSIINLLFIYDCFFWPIDFSRDAKYWGDIYDERCSGNTYRDKK
jgi:hypothetical protein